MLKSFRPPETPREPLRRRGFTLVEMLVATALVLMILVIFAQIYRSATATLVQQRGTAQNDARARMVSTLLRSDLSQATFGEHPQSTSLGLLTLDIHDVNVLGFSPVDEAQAGYVYISENDPENDVDDVMQFTIRVESSSRNPHEQPYIGRASPLGRPTSASTGTGQFNPQPVANPDQNQPEFDDGDDARTANTYNLAGQSRFAEVVYFVRRGTLYRRVLLLRDPLRQSPPPGYDDQPTYYEPNPPGGLPAGDYPLIPGDYDAVADAQQGAGGTPLTNNTPGVGDFWHDFDYAAYHTPPSDPSSQLKFHGSAALSNVANPVPRLSEPKYRFGFKFFDDGVNPAQNGQPVEYVNGGTEFIGRMTQQETSHPQFSWPGRFANSPFVQTDLILDNGVVRDTSLGVTYRGPRRGEDILLPNVDAFDLKVWDDQAGAFVDLGHSLPTGYFRASQRANPGFGPRASGLNNIFDTWHPENIAYGKAPYRPLKEPLPAPPPGANGNWQANTFYNIGARIFPFTVTDVGPDGRPGAAGVDDDMNGIVDDRGELGWTSTDDAVNYYDGIYYEATTAGTTDATPPSFRKAYDETVTDGEVVWKSFDNRAGVPLIQITIRYRDPASNLSRQLTIQHSFTDGPR
jgi:prepilin-type N-terminal cleavage/methylation domain-containing protein